MRKISIPILAAAIAALIISFAAFETARAQRPLDRMTVVAIDRASFAGDQAAQDLVKSALGLLVHLKSGKPFAFVFTDDLSNPMGPLDSGATVFRDLRDDVYEGIAAPPLSDEPLDVAGALAEIYNYMSGLNVGPNANVYLITASAAERDVETEMANVAPVLALIDASGWSIFNITTPGVNPELASELDEVALDTGGRSFSLTIPDGFWTLADDTLRREGKGLLTKLGDTVLAGSSFTFQADVVPGTERLDLLFFREESLTSFRLTNPDGREATAGDRTSSSREELPSVVIWEIVDPAPGAWIMEARAASGRLSGNMFIVNRYRIQLQPHTTVPVGQPHTIVAAVMDGDERISIDANVSARVTTPDGIQVLYNLTDDGTGGDANAGDGFFSATIPVETDGAYPVELRLFWQDIGYEITSLSSFQAQDFPQLVVLEAMDDSEIINPGARTKIATIEVTVAGIQFPISPNELTAAVITNRGAEGEVELAPKGVIAGGKAREFDVYYTPADESRATITVRLATTYGGNDFMQTTDPVVVSSILPRPTAVPPTPAPTPEPVATTVPHPTPTPPPPDTRPQTAALIVAAALAIIVIGSLIYWMSRPTPFGYIYTEEGQLAASFRDLRRAAGANIFSRSVVTGEELGVPDLEGVVFEFRGRGEIAITNSAESEHDVRLNNQPVTEATQVFDNSLIGTLGRLYVFRTARQEEAEPEDDGEA